MLKQIKNYAIKSTILIIISLILLYIDLLTKINILTFLWPIIMIISFLFAIRYWIQYDRLKENEIDNTINEINKE